MVEEMWRVFTGTAVMASARSGDLAQTFGNLRAMKPLETYSLESELHNESESLC